MRKTLIIGSVLFSIAGITFTILPMGTIAMIPILIAIVCAFLSIIKSDNTRKRIPKTLFIGTVILFLVAIGKDVFVKDKVSVDQQFMQEKQDSKQDAKKELEELEGLE